jgi:UDP-GlcNAc:undecaprenyl-phosphate/decaprenyl-phosphate GlcNAc-1-phosphate transferase
MQSYLLIFAAALTFAVGGTPIARYIARRLGLTDQPSARKVHAEPMPLLGGAAIYAAVILAMLLFGKRGEIVQLAGILIGATMVSFLGLWDDRQPLRPALKLLGQLAATVILIASGVRVQAFGSVLIDTFLTVLWVLAITNAINFMDNMDGMAGGVAAIAAGAYLLLAVGNGQQLVAPLSAAVLGACLGFLVYNFSPATIIMGDQGSLFLGFVLAAIGIKLRFPGRPTDVTWMIPVLVMAVPLFDLSLVLISRLRRHVNPFTTGGTDHLSHRLAATGRSHRQAAVFIYTLSGIAGGMALIVSRASAVAAYALLAAAAAAGLYGLWRLEFAAQAEEELQQDARPA